MIEVVGFAREGSDELRLGGGEVREGLGAFGVVDLEGG